VARKNAAAAQRKVAEAMSGVGNADNAFSALNRFEETVSKEEATAQAFDQLASAGKDDDLEAQFATLGGHSVDAELEAMKADRQKAAKPAPPVLPKELAAPTQALNAGQKAGEKAGA
jgi:phage shock protein A